MEALSACAGLIAVGAITPGPNNLAVLRIAVGRGVQSALPAIAAVVLGGLAMLALARIGIATLIDSSSWLRSVIAVCGATYLVWLGFTLVWRSFQPVAAQSERGAPEGVLAMFVFQFCNPKSWTLVLTVSAAAPSSGDGMGALATAMLFVLFLAIPSAALRAWAASGRFIAPLLREVTVRARFERAMGLLLAASALALLAHQ